VLVTVTEHAVRVSARARAEIILAGQMCRYSAEALGDTRPADPTSLSWRQGQLAFISRPLGEVVATLNRWKTGRTIILDDALARHPVTLVIAISDVRDALIRLGASLPMRISEITPLLTVIRSAP
jgi:transmembrane sensor